MKPKMYALHHAAMCTIFTILLTFLNFFENPEQEYGSIALL